MIEQYYIGTDLKFLLQVECEGYSLGDGFSIELRCGGKTYQCTDNDVTVDADGNYYLLVDSTKFNPGVMQMIFKAEVPDADFDDDYRTEIAVINLCKLKTIPAPSVGK